MLLQVKVTVRKGREKPQQDLPEAKRTLAVKPRRTDPPAKAQPSWMVNAKAPPAQVRLAALGFGLI